uniref:Uncharacterized protein n=1 Tax=Arundo donax TaxID=35708 RepID=A0A0A8YGR4_ARUDO
MPQTVARCIDALSSLRLMCSAERGMGATCPALVTRSSGCRIQQCPHLIKTLAAATMIYTCAQFLGCHVRWK